MSLNDCAPKRNTQCLRCCVYDCDIMVGSQGYEFYKIPTTNKLFPHKLARRTAWLNAIKLLNSDGSAWVPNAWDRICSGHFVGNKKSEDPRSPSYNPTIFPDAYRKRKINTEEVTNRYKRHLKRAKVEEKIVVQPFKIMKCEEHWDEALTAADSLPNDCYTEEMLQKVDVGVQVDFLESGQQTCLTFISCNRYVTNATCDAETQAFGPAPVTVKNEENLFTEYSSIKVEQEIIDFGDVTLPL